MSLQKLEGGRHTTVSAKIRRASQGRALPLNPPMQTVRNLPFPPPSSDRLAALHMAPTANVVISPLHKLIFSFIPCEGWVESCFSVRNKYLLV